MFDYIFGLQIWLIKITIHESYRLIKISCLNKSYFALAKETKFLDPERVKIRLVFKQVTVQSGPVAFIFFNPNGL